MGRFPSKWILFGWAVIRGYRQPISPLRSFAVREPLSAISCNARLCSSGGSFEKSNDFIPELNVGADRGLVPIKLHYRLRPQSNSHLVVERRHHNEPHYQLPFIRNAPFF
jgi:hypothetical protein